MTTRQIRGGALSAVGLVCALAVSASVVRAQSALPTGWASRDVGSTGMVGSAAVSSGTWTVAGSGSQHLGHFRRIPVRVSADHRRRRHPRQARELRGRQSVVEGRRDDPGDAERQLAQRLHDAHAGQRCVHAVATEPRRGNGAPDWSRWGCSCLVASGPTGQPVHRLLFRERDVLDDGRYGDGQHDRRSVCRPGGDEPAPTRRLSTATFTNLQVSASGSGSGSGTTTLPAPWTSRDLGGPALAGSASAAGGTFTVTAGGKDIWETSDQFHFVYQPLQGDVEVIARVASLQQRGSVVEGGRHDP